MGSRLLAALDIGSYNITAVIGTNRDGTNKVEGYGHSPAVGFKKGTIYDIQSCLKSVKTALEQAEKMAGVSVDSCFVGFSGCQVLSSNVCCGIDVNENKISDHHLGLLHECCIAQVCNKEHIPLHLLPRAYGLDAHWGVVDPVGLKGGRLEIEAHLILGQKMAVESIKTVINSAGLHPMGLFYTPLVQAESMLQPAEKELGAMLIDIGGNTTGLCWFHRGHPWLTTSIPVGGEHITSDLAIGLRIPLSVAAMVKEKYGLLNTRPDEKVEVQVLQNSQAKIVSRQLANEIIEARMFDLVDLIKQYIDIHGGGRRPSEIVLVGGGSRLLGIKELFHRTVDLPVRFGEDDKYPGVVTAGYILEHGYNNTDMGLNTPSKFLTRINTGLKSMIHKFIKN